MATLLIRNKQEEYRFEKLLEEFKSKVLTGRNSNTTFTEYFGVTEIVEDECTGDKYFELKMAPHYVKFIQYLIDNKKD